MGMIYAGIAEKALFQPLHETIRLATKMSPYNSFMLQSFCNTLEYVNSKQITKECF